MTLEYGDGWFRAKCCLTGIDTPDWARDRHENRKLYAAAKNGRSGPEWYVEVNDDYIGVGFIDGKGREYLFYVFDEVEPGRLFLREARCRDYDGNSERMTYGTVYFFSQDGQVSVTKTNVRTNETESLETHADVSSNWDTYPQFGCYESITREER